MGLIRLFYLPVFLPVINMHIRLSLFVKSNHPLLYVHVIKTQTNMGKECIIVEGFTFRTIYTCLNLPNCILFIHPIDTFFVALLSCESTSKIIVV